MYLAEASGIITFDIRNLSGYCRFGEMRKYDVREGGKQRRPVAELTWVEEAKVL